ncbi:heme utilization cystosolic carrier protein HutX [Psychromonas sp. RZ22]|uniref:heme utilization cystosolic carrier protein HutX n=1 Tax=Psychromonas algarum TaxID=2555643 RepID=UPI001067D567|nr:heme utilization cystosolic carrier protein HutX [Psychromonas sp. RZ22]TEW54162.1 heme utilization cystosolic carrier protein HutX [Psychromonas sp. RZ22]
MPDILTLDKTLASQVNDILKEQPSLLPIDVANLLNTNEAAVVFAMPGNDVVRISGEYAQDILEDLPAWGPVTTIVRVLGSIFEVKGAFPKGKLAYGYYNLNPGKGQFHGHLRLDLITDIALVSKPFRGTESHYFGFFNAQGESVFKIYLGRDAKRVLLADQVQKFLQLKQTWGQL